MVRAAYICTAIPMNTCTPDLLHAIYRQKAKVNSVRIPLFMQFENKFTTAATTTTTTTTTSTTTTTTTAAAAAAAAAAATTVAPATAAAAEKIYTAFC